MIQVVSFTSAAFEAFVEAFVSLYKKIIFAFETIFKLDFIT